jgi:hypothetical protein
MLPAGQCYRIRLYISFLQNSNGHKESPYPILTLHDGTDDFPDLRALALVTSVHAEELGALTVALPVVCAHGGIYNKIYGGRERSIIWRAREVNNTEGDRGQ